MKTTSKAAIVRPVKLNRMLSYVMKSFYQLSVQVSRRRRLRMQANSEREIGIIISNLQCFLRYNKVDLSKVRIDANFKYDKSAILHVKVLSRNSKVEEKKMFYVLYYK